MFTLLRIVTRSSRSVLLVLLAAFFPIALLRLQPYSCRQSSTCTKVAFLHARLTSCTPDSGTKLSPHHMAALDTFTKVLRPTDHHSLKAGAQARWPGQRSLGLPCE